MVVGEISQQRDIVIIGGGSGGYTAAIRGAQLGLSITLIEQSDMGGVCLNEGCIPSKIFTHAAAKYVETSHLADLGISNDNVDFEIKKLHAYKKKVINKLRIGVESLCKENKIEIIRGKATFLAVDRIGVENGHQFDIFEFKKAIIATGSSLVMPNDIIENQKQILLADEIFELEEMPEHLIVEGSDYIALEVASSYAALGSKVTILVDHQEDFPFDESVNKELNRLFKKRKIRVFKTGGSLSIEEIENGISITFDTNKNVKETICGSYLFMAGKRKPNVESIGISRLGIEQTQQGLIKINEHMQSSISTIYAIGDVTEGPLLAVKAIKQGKAAVEAIAGNKPEVDLTFLPIVAHTIPPVATVGLTEKSAQELGMDLRVSLFSLRRNGYAILTDKKDGFIKVISDATTDLIIGVHMIGEGAIEMSGSFVQLLEMAAKEEDVKFPSYAHPGFNEGLLESVEGLVGQAIHRLPF